MGWKKSWRETLLFSTPLGILDGDRFVGQFKHDLSLMSHDNGIVGHGIPYLKEVFLIVVTDLYGLGAYTRWSDDDIETMT